MTVTRGDREIVLGAIRSRLLTLQTIRPWQKNPDILLQHRCQCRLHAHGAQVRARPKIACAR